MNGFDSTAMRRLSAVISARNVSNLQHWCLLVGVLASIALAVGVAELRAVQASARAALAAATAAPAMSSPRQRFIARTNDELESMRRVDVLLARANEHMAALRLTHPPGRSAWDQFNAVLAISPGNVDAYHGLTRIADRYLALSNAASSAGQTGRARRHACKATAVQRASLLLDEPTVVASEALQGTFERCVADGSRLS